MRRRRSDIPIHLALITIATLTLLPFFFVLNNSFRRTSETYHGFFGMPNAAKDGARFTWLKVSGHAEDIRVHTTGEETRGGQVSDIPMTYADAMRHVASELTRGYRFAWNSFRPFMLNSLFVSGLTALGVIVIGSVTAYVFSRHSFPGRRVLFLVVLSFMMIPAVLTLVPSVLWCKKLGLLNSYSVLILPYITGGQIIAIFLLFKGFFDALPQELFESARLDGAGHFAQYWHIVLPLSKQIIAVVAIMNILGTWNNFLWPLITNTDAKYAVVSSGLFIMSQTAGSAQADSSVMYAAYVISAIPLLILFLYATKPFMTGVTSGAFKA